MAALFCACKSSREVTRDDSPARSETTVETTAEPLRAGDAPSSSAAEPSEGLGGAAASTGDRPSLDEQMGRGFQGTLRMRLTREGQIHDVRYLTRGNAARLQVDARERAENDPATHFDTLIWDDHISYIDHGKRSVKTWSLEDVPVREEGSSEVDIEKTGERQRIHGVTCERYRMTQGDLRVDACVGALPGTFDVNKLESVSGMDVPAWVEQLMADDLLPLRGVARDTRGVEQYSFDLLEYSAGPVDDAQLTLPPHYSMTRQ